VIKIKSKEEIKILREANRIVAKTLNSLKSMIKPGVSTEELDRRAEDFLSKEGAVPAFKGYRGYPASICASINEVVVHGIPSREKILKDGDLLSIDLGVKLKGYYGDATVSYLVGSVDKETKEIFNVTKEALYKGIDKCRPGNRLYDISYAIQSYAESNGYNVVRDFVGHGIGKELHEEPQIPNYGKPHTGPLLKEGMVFAIEPMITQGTWEVKTLEDGWTVVTLDGALSCHFEHTIAIMENGPVILSEE
jgi:methionyl aminopeptidase